MNNSALAQIGGEPGGSSRKFTVAGAMTSANHSRKESLMGLDQQNVQKIYN